jgi:uncharacterized repeat protein (TIGR02543 family)
MVNGAVLLFLLFACADPYSEPLGFEVRYETSGGTPIPSITVSPGGLLPTPELTPELQGYHFCGWTFDPEGRRGVDFGTRRVDGPITVYARWLPGSYLVSFDSRGGSCVLSLAVTSPSRTVADLPVPTREGYEFEAWRAEADGSVFTVGTEVYSDVRLYASWRAVGYPVTFETGESRVTLRALPPDFTIGELPPAPLREGYEFAGWYDSPEGGEALDSSTRVRGELRAYPRWKEKTVTIRFDPRGGAGPDPIVVRQGASIGALPKRAIRFGWDFLGWFASPEGGAPIDASFVASEDLVLYAHWGQRSKYVVECVSMIGYSLQCTIIYLDEPILKELPEAPQGYGYAFGGWWTGPGGSGVRAEIPMALEGNLALYAKWDPYEYEVRFDSAGGTPVAPVRIASPNKCLDARLEYPTREGYRFVCWKTEKEGGSIFFSWTPVTGDITLYAQWAPLKP